MSSIPHGYPHAADDHHQQHAGPLGGRPLTAEEQRIVAQLTKLAVLMDARFRVPILGTRIGWDGLIGLIPGVGDAFGAAVSAYIIWKAQGLGVSRVTTAKMIANVLVEFLVGEILVVGDLFDIAFKANLRNLRLLGIHPPSQLGR